MIASKTNQSFELREECASIPIPLWLQTDIFQKS
ncbi:uncharacterized protein METZ01_LOCUS332057 [marine metagenome]|uniref:Uncharacterized protein n=1 Tax=marine metagenome TaxID=408172 RepID=A0A382Q0T0_9ZZZZ